MDQCREVTRIERLALPSEQAAMDLASRPCRGFMGSFDLQLWTRIGAMNPVGAPDSDPARCPAIAIEPHRSAARRFMESNHKPGR